MFFCTFWEVFKNTFFIEAPGATASESSSQAVCLDIITKTIHFLILNSTQKALKCTVKIEPKPEEDSYYT